MSLKVNLVAADKRIWSGEADMIVAPSVDGEIGLLTGHEPVMTLLAPGKVKVSSSDQKGETHITTVSVTGGFLSLYDNEVSIVADDAIVD